MTILNTLKSLWLSNGLKEIREHKWKITILKFKFKWTGYKVSKWKYFTDEESVGMSDDLCFKRDRARELYGLPIYQTSGYRSPERNAEIGGVSQSAHTKVMAFDMKAPSDPFLREKLMWALGAAGFRRVESAPKHFHADVDDSKPTPCFWQGDDK